MLTKTFKLRRMDGSRFAAVVPEASQEIIDSLVMEEFRCWPSQIGRDQGDINKDEPFEFITIDGKRVAFLDEGKGLSPDYAETIPESFKIAAE